MLDAPTSLMRIKMGLVSVWDIYAILLIDLRKSAMFLMFMTNNEGMTILTVLKMCLFFWVVEQ